MPELIPVDYDPFAAEHFVNPAVKNAIAGLATLPQRAIENSQYSIDTGNYDPSVPVEAALTVVGGAGAVPAEANTLRSGASLIKSSGMSTVTPEMRNAYSLGQKIRAARDNWRASKSPTGSFDHDLAYGHIEGIAETEADKAASLPPVLDGFYQSGYQGLPPPSFARGSRFGDAPKEGRSWNYRENEYEPGVSMARVDHPDFKDYEWADMGGNRQRELSHYEGWLLPFKGSDDEPLMVGLRPSSLIPVDHDPFK